MPSDAKGQFVSSETSGRQEASLLGSSPQAYEAPCCWTKAGCCTPNTSWRVGHWLLSHLGGCPNSPWAATWTESWTGADDLLGLGWVRALHLGFDGKGPWGLHWGQTLYLFCWWGEHGSQGQRVLLLHRSPSWVTPQAADT